MYDIDYLQHHGVKGQKWGVRRYQYTDGSLTPLGRSRIRSTRNSSTAFKRGANRIVSAYYNTKVNRIDTKKANLGNRYADTVLSKNTSLYRIQSNDVFENFAFYATYKKHDVEEYAGLFGKNLRNRASNNDLPIYQLRISNLSKLKVPSENNASHIVGKLLKDDSFKEDTKASISDSALIMRRPSQQILFNSAMKSLNKDASSMTDNDRRTIYRAINLSLTNHNEQQVRMQKKLYSEMKNNGYSALLDLNDKSYSSYHAKSPVIVFDTSKVALQSVTNLDSNKIDKLYKKYNTERLIKEVPEQVVGTLARAGNVKVSECNDYVMGRLKKYYS